ncbi:MAG: pentapeptide repeat protein, partial [Polaromonas sp.]|nr:pentapeptide repeat protein [Polaromonas sp.]
MARWAAGLMMAASLVLASSCGGSDGAAPSPVATGEPGNASVAVARINAAQGVLELPLLQSGELLYADVRIGFLADGTFNLLSWRLAAAASSPADAVLQPQVALAALALFPQLLTLTISRLHMDAEVYENVTVELENGRWRYPRPLMPATTLTSQDLRANPALFARDHQLMMIASTPARAEVFSLRLENKAYQFCMEAQDDGADTMDLLDGQGAPLLTVRAGGPCAAYTAEQGLYQIRYTYGGSGTGRTLFMRQRPTDPPAVTQPANTSPLLQDASNPKEYWGVLASFLDPTTQRVRSSSFLGMAGSWRQEGRHPGTDCNGSIAAVVTPTTLTQQRANALTVATHLFDGMNFFERIDDTAGTPRLLGAPWGCNSELLGFYPLFYGESAMVMTKANSGPAAAHPVRIDSFSAATNTFGLKGASGIKGITLPDAPLGFPLGVEPRLFTGLRPLTPDQIAGALPEYRTVLRYRPDGFARLTAPALGQVALFNSRDCSGAAMVVDNYDLPGIMAGGRLGNFDGSLKLGAQTTATVYSGMRQQGERQQLNALGCIASGWGASGWKAASLSIIAGSVQFLVSSKSCEQCNLAGANLARADLSNGKFAGAILNNANLAQANLSGADLRYASLQGAQLPNANLDAANLCEAQLNAAPSSASLTNAAANLSGAFLRNAYLYGTNMAGANFGDASFFSTSAGSCQAQACSTYHKPACASAYSATLEGTKFNNAYLAGVDMSNAA